jgi:transposase-like protein
MAAVDEENCPTCLADRSWAVIMAVKVTITGLRYTCPECNASFTADELLVIYGWAKERYRGD